MGLTTLIIGDASRLTVALTEKLRAVSGTKIHCWPEPYSLETAKRTLDKYRPDTIIQTAGLSSFLGGRFEFPKSFGDLFLTTNYLLEAIQALQLTSRFLLGSALKPEPPTDLETFNFYLTECLLRKHTQTPSLILRFPKPMMPQDMVAFLSRHAASEWPSTHEIVYKPG